MVRASWSRSARCRGLLLLVAIGGLAINHPASCLSAIHVPSDYPTIGLALQNAAVGDSVIVACGTYAESGLILHPGATLRSETGDPSCVTIEGGYQGSIVACTGAGVSARLEGLTIAHGGWLVELPAYGGGLKAQDCTLNVSNCLFESNFGGQGGGAIYASGSTLTLEDCSFVENRGTGAPDGGGEGGAIYAFESQVGVVACTFLGNHADTNLGGAGGAIRLSNSDLDVQDCLFNGNWTYGNGGGCLYFSGTTTSIRRTTFLENRAGGNTGSGIAAGAPGSLMIESCLFVKAPSLWSGCEIYVSSSVPLTVVQSTFIALGVSSNNAYIEGGDGPMLTNSLFVLSDGVAAFRCGVSSPSFDCCDIYSPEGSAWVDCYADQLGVNGNISADPQFCGEPGSGNYYLQSDSPCAPANNTCGELIGALPVGCEAVATKAGSISAIKSLY